MALVAVYVETIVKLVSYKVGSGNTSARAFKSGQTVWDEKRGPPPLRGRKDGEGAHQVGCGRHLREAGSHDSCTHSWSLCEGRTWMRVATGVNKCKWKCKCKCKEVLCFVLRYVSKNSNC